MAGPAAPADASPPIAFRISVSRAARSEPLTGRVLLVISRTKDPDVCSQAGGADSPPMFAAGARQLAPSQAVVIDAETYGYPLQSLRELPAGDYFVQACAIAYVRYPRADGHTIWALDQWDGHEHAASPGSLHSAVRRLHLDPSVGGTVDLELTDVVRPAPPPEDTAWVKHVKIRSEMLSKFWGRPIYLGADVILPKDYATRPELRYPIIYEPRNHYVRAPAFDFTSDARPESENDRREREALGYETGFEFFQKWSGDGFPRVIVATIIEPTPYYDFASSMNSDNNGPYEDAIMQELIPYIEKQFRVMREPYARMLVGKSSGARDALSLQLHHPEVFGGVWAFYPWEFDYKYYAGDLDIYDARNAFVVDRTETGGVKDESVWTPPLDRILTRTLDGKPVYTLRDWIHAELVMGGRPGVDAEITGSDDALNGPVGDDGYPKPLYDKLTGVIDHGVAQYWRGHDLAVFAERNWPVIGPGLVGKLHVYIGDMDEWQRNFAVHDFQRVLEQARGPAYGGSFEYGPLKGHGWQPMTNAELVRTIADDISRHSNKEEGGWHDR
jgi:hypothetical protein